MPFYTLKVCHENDCHKNIYTVSHEQKNLYTYFPCFDKIERFIYISGIKWLMKTILQHFLQFYSYFETAVRILSFVIYRVLHVQNWIYSCIYLFSKFTVSFGIKANIWYCHKLFISVYKNRSCSEIIILFPKLFCIYLYRD